MSPLFYWLPITPEEVRKADPVNPRYFDLKKCYSRKALVFAGIIYLILILITAVNTNRPILFSDAVAQFTNTLEKDLLYTPGGIVLLCCVWDSRDIYVVRFSASRIWLMKETKFSAIVLFVYSFVYVLLAMIANAIAAIPLHGDISIDLSSAVVVLLTFIKRYLFVLLIFTCGIAGAQASGKSILVTGFLSYIAFELEELLELVLSVKILTPVIIDRLSLIKNILLMLPTAGLLILVTVSIFICKNTRRRR